jgi:hypothetical protein
MYLSGSQVRRENWPPCTINEGGTINDHKEEKRKGPRPTIIRKRDFRTRGRKYHWMRWKRGCTHMEREDGLRHCCLSPPRIQLQGHLRRQPTVPRGTTSSLEELDLRIKKCRTRTLHEVNDRAKLRSHRINKAEFDHREWGVRGSVGWGGD